MEQQQPQQEHRGHHDHRDFPRHGAGRVIVYFVALIVLNLMLAVYSVYMLGMALAFDWSILKSGTLQVIMESALQLLLFFSPAILTLLLNRLLYRAFRGHGRFPRGIWFFAMLAIIVIQVSAVAFIFSYGYVDGINGLNIEQLTATPIE
ncbi:hypothetical protein SDC9_97258 [bioreactor metagenome]|uniref:Uncharacterized protein n=1 Tax=bioreactor metagenome TaxID=1076179 RepID=A0A645AC44_9ZZZZ